MVGWWGGGVVGWWGSGVVGWWSGGVALKTNSPDHAARLHVDSAVDGVAADEERREPVHAYLS